MLLDLRLQTHDWRCECAFVKSSSITYNNESSSQCIRLIDFSTDLAEFGSKGKSEESKTTCI